MERFIQRLKKFIESPANVFLSIALPFGLILVFLTPPMQGPDEHHHFFRAYQVSTGNMIPDIYKGPGDSGVGGMIPDSIKTAGYDLLGNLPGNPENKASSQIIHKYLNMPVSVSKKGFAHFEPGSSSSTIPYLPPAAGIKIADLLGGSVLHLFYAGRAFNLFVWLALAYFAVKIIPSSRYVYLLLLLSPVMIFQAAALSPDAMTNGLSFLYVAILLRLILSKDLIHLPQLALVVFVAAGLASCKQAYFLIGLLGLVLPISRFASKKQYFAYVSTLIAACLIPPALWAIQASQFLPLLNQVFQPGQAVSPVGQISHALHHPLSAAVSFIRTVFTSFSDYIFLEFYGRMGWADVRLPVWLIFLEYIVLIYVVAASIPPKLSLWQKRLAIVVAISVVGALAGVVYLSWTPVGDAYVRGLQGRYFIPISALLVFLIPERKIVTPISASALQKLTAVWPLMVLAFAVISVYIRYY